jgi:hypothetical protein
MRVLSTHEATSIAGGNALDTTTGSFVRYGPPTEQPLQSIFPSPATVIVPLLILAGEYLYNAMH